MVEILCPIAQMAQERPEQIALCGPSETYSYRQLNGAVAQLVGTLQKEGIGAESTVAFLAYPHVKTILFLFALFRLRAVAFPLSFRIPQLQVEALLTQIPGARLFSSVPNHSGIMNSTQTLDTEILATFLMTSGSSSSPKIARHTLGNHYFNALEAAHAVKLTPKSRWLLALPLFHVSGISVLFRSFITGSSVVLSEDPISLALDRCQITHLSLVPTQLFRLIQEPQTYGSLQCALIGGGPLSPSLYHRAVGCGLPLFLTYGMTEMSSMITLATPDEGGETVGRVLPYREVDIAEDGEIWVRGKTLFAGYLETVNGFRFCRFSEGWFPTRDLGEWTRDGKLRWLGRKDRLFISGGENIQPEEIERALCAIPGILAAHVLPQADAEFGARPTAYILEERPHHTLASVKAALQDRLPSFKHPVQVFPFTQQMREEIKPKALAKIQG